MPDEILAIGAGAIFFGSFALVFGIRAIPIVVYEIQQWLNRRPKGRG